MRVDFFRLSEMDAALWQEVMALRSDVFVLEQQCVYLDPDKEDTDAIHLLFRDEETITGYLRIIEKEDWHLGRIIVPQSHRGKGLGKELVTAGVNFCKQQASQKDIVMSSQVYLSDFYSSLGFAAEGHMYLEDGIPHIHMVFNEALKAAVD